MSIDRAGVPFIVGALAPALGLWVIGFPWAAAILGAVALFLAFFFRDPERPTWTGSARSVIAPADGRVMVAGTPQPGVAPPGRWLQISIFLSPLDVHVNRVPYSGTVAQVEYRPGRFLAAYAPESALENERSEIWVRGAHQTVVFRQIVGVLARRVVCRLRPGDTVRAGDRFGIMKFGSRMDVFVPDTSELRVAVGQRVRAAVTEIARLDDVS